MKFFKTNSKSSSDQSAHNASAASGFPQQWPYRRAAVAAGLFDAQRSEASGS